MVNNKKNTNPLVSIIIPTKNRSKYLRKSILSILNQDYNNIEIVIIDDGSTDNTKNTIESLNSEKIKYFYLSDSTDIAKNRNKGISVSNGDIISFCDDDDLWYPNKLSIQIPYLEKYDAVCANADLIDSKDNLLGLPMNNEKYDSQLLTTEKLMLLGNLIVTPSFTIRRESLVNLFVERNSRYSIEDYELWLKLSLSIKIYYSNEKLVQVRKHNSNTTSFDKNTTYIRLLKQVMFILNDYRDYPKIGIRKCALIGKLKQQKELSKVYFKNKQYLMFFLEIILLFLKSLNITVINYILFKKKFEFQYLTS